MNLLSFQLAIVFSVKAVCLSLAEASPYLQVINNVAELLVPWIQQKLKACLATRGGDGDAFNWITEQCVRGKYNTFDDCTWDDPSESI
mmetsp:Transcript_17129/g.37135  ORF Transcript_17129/g.37135 Transcript_17129/m.37135 type:complete len:88 (-) Transcript_17129:956-1219(-)